MANFGSLGDEMVHMYKDRYALLANLRGFFRTLRDEVKGVRAELSQASAHRRRELRKMLKEANDKRKSAVGEMVQGFVEMIGRFREESAERAGAWREIVASIPRAPGEPEPSSRRSSPRARRRAAEAAGG